MTIFRYAEEQNYKNYKDTGRLESIDTYWDDDYDLKDIGGWENRHTHEANIISSIITKLDIKKVLELGAGPGNVADKVINSTNVTYHIVDGESAKRAHTRREYKGDIFVKDLYDSFDTKGLDSDYQLLITNDFLEHIRNPSLILEKIRNDLTTDTAWYFLSTPNWRMKHTFFYPGLFDFDNIVKFMWQEGFSIQSVYDSWAKHVPITTQRLSSESGVPEGHLLDWNYYLLFEKR